MLPAAKMFLKVMVTEDLKEKPKPEEVAKYMLEAMEKGRFKYTPEQQKRLKANKQIRTLKEFKKATQGFGNDPDANARRAKLVKWYQNRSHPAARKEAMYQLVRSVRSEPHEKNKAPGKKKKEKAAR